MWIFTSTSVNMYSSVFQWLTEYCLDPEPAEDARDAGDTEDAGDALLPKSDCFGEKTGLWLGASAKTEVPLAFINDSLKKRSFIGRGKMTALGYVFEEVVELPEYAGFYKADYHDGLLYGVNTMDLLQIFDVTQELPRLVHQQNLLETVAATIETNGDEISRIRNMLIDRGGTQQLISDVPFVSVQPEDNAHDGCP